MSVTAVMLDSHPHRRPSLQKRVALFAMAVQAGMSNEIVSRSDVRMNA